MPAETASRLTSPSLCALMEFLGQFWRKSTSGDSGAKCSALKERLCFSDQVTSWNFTMLIKTTPHGTAPVNPSDITPLAIFQSRRELIQLMVSGVTGAALAAWAGREALAQRPTPKGQLLPLQSIVPLWRTL